MGFDVQYTLTICFYYIVGIQLLACTLNACLDCDDIYDITYHIYAAIDDLGLLLFWFT